MRSCGEKKIDNAARERLGSGGDLWSGVVNNGDVFISCELISQVVIGAPRGQRRQG